MHNVTLGIVANLALALWIAYGVAHYIEIGDRERGSAGLRTLSALTQVALVVALVWAGWFA